MSVFPDVRLRRLRRTNSLRNMTDQPFPGPEKFIWPVFVIEGKKQKNPIQAMPRQYRYSIDTLISAVESLVKDGVGGILLFGVLDNYKSETGQYAFDDDGLVQQAVRKLKTHFPELSIFTDICLCAYTDHGHCGVLDQCGDVDNDQTLELLDKIAISHANAGVDGVAPSAMMDGQVLSIRNALDNEGFSDTIIMSYSTKFASSLYGPFREAAQSKPGTGDRRSYQASYKDGRQALRESYADIDEGADILMVKPSLFYLDIILKLREMCFLPIAAYNVSGEYSMLVASSQNGWGDLNSMVQESIMALGRAGTDIFISYWANQYADIFGAGDS